MKDKLIFIILSIIIIVIIVISVYQTSNNKKLSNEQLDRKIKERMLFELQVNGFNRR